MARKEFASVLIAVRDWRRSMEAPFTPPVLPEVAKCDDCGGEVPLAVLHSNAGYYVGRFCRECGPWCRYSEYYDKLADAEKDMEIRKERGW